MNGLLSLTANGEVPHRRTLWAILGEAETQNSDLEDLEKSEIRDPKSVFSNFLKSDWASQMSSWDQKSSLFCKKLINQRNFCVFEDFLKGVFEISLFGKTLFTGN